MSSQSNETRLRTMTRTTPSALWNDSCSLQELSASIKDNGAVGATCNPVIVLTVLKKEMHLWKDRMGELISEMACATEGDVAWRLVEEMSIKAAELLRPVFEREKGRNGRLSIQTDPRFYRDPKLIVSQAERFNSLAPNMIVKIPATSEGIVAIEEATYRGISINATVSFTLPQAIAVAEAVERGLTRREKEKKDISRMGPVCTLMVGRLDDWLKVLTEKHGIIADPRILDWAGVATFKKAYRIYRERGYRLRLLSAAFRNHLHWSELIGGDVVISPPFEWQKRFNESDVEVKSRIDNEVDPQILDELLRKFADFGRAYEEKGMRPAEFDDFGATRRTLRQFCKAVDDLVVLIRDRMIVNPDV
ncbi:MAG TPA: transaldolase family protein [Spirochaetia bacterium]|nr:transaldolase family protein [Spirochaetia bacterium]